MNCWPNYWYIRAQQRLPHQDKIIEFWSIEPCLILKKCSRKFFLQKIWYGSKTQNFTLIPNLKTKFCKKFTNKSNLKKTSKRQFVENKFFCAFFLNFVFRFFFNPYWTIEEKKFHIYIFRNRQCSILLNSIDMFWWGWGRGAQNFF